MANMPASASSSSPKRKAAAIPTREDSGEEADIASLKTTLDKGETEFSWSRPTSWNASLQLAPVAVALVIAFISIYWTHVSVELNYEVGLTQSCRQTFDYKFPVNAVQDRAERLASHDWEYGAAAEALLELLEPELSVFAPSPFPADKVPSLPARKPRALSGVEPHIRTSNVTLYANDWSVSDPASLGVSAILLGQAEPKFLQDAMRQKDYLLKTAPRYGDGAISHRTQVAELWSDAISMFPPFLAYYAVASNDLDLMHEVIRQCALYRGQLMITSGTRQGLWKHIVGPSELADDGAWSTGVGWAAHGMSRIRATMTGWRPSQESMSHELQQLDLWILEILDGVIRTDDDESGLLRNYLGEGDWAGETSGTALLTAAAYRMAVQMPRIFAQAKYLDWADRKRKAVFEHVGEHGHAYPAVNPLNHKQREPILQSPEGASFVLMLGAAWRDCVCAGICGSNAR